jgi:asparagine synthase (glutamine-hydrolysing)
VPRGRSARSRLYDLARFARTLEQPTAVSYASWFGFFDGAAELLDDDFAAATGDADVLAPMARAFDSHSALDPVDQAMAADIAVYLPDDLLVKVDVATMAVGLEARSPFLDRELMSLAASLPAELKVPRGRTKALLRAAVADLVPREILSRGKTGFAVPLDSWLRGGLREMVHDLLLGPHARSRTHVKRTAVETLIGEHMRAEASHAHRLWALLMLELGHVSAVEGARRSRRTAA